jgi:hypothetical protein
VLRLNKLFLFFGLFLVMVVQAAPQGRNAPYLQFTLGTLTGVQPGASDTFDTLNFSHSNTSKSQKAHMLAVGGGYQFTLAPKLKLQVGGILLQTGAIKIKGETFDPTGGKVFGYQYQTKSTALLSQAIVDYYLTDNQTDKNLWKLDAGLLLGFAKTSNGSYSQTTTPSASYSTTTLTSLAYGLVAGAGYQINSRHSVGLNLAYLSLGKAGVNASGDFPKLPGNTLSGLSLMLNYQLSL